MRYFIYGSIAIVALLAIFGFYVAGSPAAERVRRYDERRILDLQTIQGQIIRFWQSKGVLPANLDELRDDIAGWQAPIDPKTKAAYGYLLEDEKNFSLCAVFSLPSELLTAAASPYGENWTHPTGEYCFDRTIDPDLYPVFEEVLEKVLPVRR